MEGFAVLADRLSAGLARGLPAPEARDGRIPAAVTLLLRPAFGAGDRVDAEILFIRRVEREGDPWSGHIALPGGRAGAADPDLLAVAVRETREEVGVDILRGGRVLGRLPAVAPLSERLPPIAVTPFVALAPDGAVVRPDPAEVADAFWLAMSTLRRAGLSETVRHVIRGERREWRAYPSPAGPIWGITERILTAFLEIAG